MPPLSHSLLAAGLLSLSAGAIAQPPGPPPTGGPGGPGRMMAGPHMPITRTELQAQLTQLFERLDANKDGRLSGEDRTARKEERQDRMFSRLDTDKDGSISKQEFAAGQDRPGMKRDRRGAGGSPAAGAPRQGALAMADGHRPGKPGMPGAPRFMKMDQASGPISKSDFVANGLARFDKVDTDHDGTISPAERDAARDTMRDLRGRATMPPPRPQTATPGQ